MIAPAVRRGVGQVAVDDDRLRRLVEIVLDLLQLGDAGAFGDVERAVVEGEAVRPVEAGRDHLDLALAVAVDHRIDLVEHAVADEQRAAFGQPAACAHSRCRWHRPRPGSPSAACSCASGSLSTGVGDRRRRDAAQLLGDLGIGDVGAARHRALLLDLVRDLLGLAGVLAGCPARARHRRPQNCRGGGKADAAAQVRMFDHGFLPGMWKSWSGATRRGPASLATVSDRCHPSRNRKLAIARQRQIAKKNRTLAGPVSVCRRGGRHHLPEGNNCRQCPSRSGRMGDSSPAATMSVCRASTSRTTRSAACQPCGPRSLRCRILHAST